MSRRYQLAHLSPHRFGSFRLFRILQSSFSSSVFTLNPLQCPLPLVVPKLKLVPPLGDEDPFYRFCCRRPVPVISQRLTAADALANPAFMSGLIRYVYRGSAGLKTSQIPRMRLDFRVTPVRGIFSPKRARREPAADDLFYMRMEARRARKPIVLMK